MGAGLWEETACSGAQSLCQLCGGETTLFHTHIWNICSCLAPPLPISSCNKHSNWEIHFRNTLPVPTETRVWAHPQMGTSLPHASSWLSKEETGDQSLQFTTKSWVIPMAALTQETDMCYKSLSCLETSVVCVFWGSDWCRKKGSMKGTSLNERRQGGTQGRTRVFSMAFQGKDCTSHALRWQPRLCVLQGWTGRDILGRSQGKLKCLGKGRAWGTWEPSSVLEWRIGFPRIFPKCIQLV